MTITSLTIEPISMFPLSQAGFSGSHIEVALGRIPEHDSFMHPVKPLCHWSTTRPWSADFGQLRVSVV
ncbi:hypothetical protein J6590_002821 [Homalodisca vitripennis]|nr:hypothetical protein J6590_002821 [Homalodisca vitripennis]